MSNRVLQQKRVKIKRMRRAYLKSDHHAARSDLIQQYHGSAAGTSAFDAWFYHLDHIPDDATAVTDMARRAQLGLQSPLSVIKSYKEELRERVRNFVEEPIQHSVVLVNAMPSFAVLLFWSVGQHSYWFVRKDVDAGMLYKSQRYSSRDRAMRHFNYESINYTSSMRITL